MLVPTRKIASTMRAQNSTQANAMADNVTIVADDRHAEPPGRDPFALTS